MARRSPRTGRGRGSGADKKKRPSTRQQRVAQEYEAIWAQMQDELAALSPRGRVVVAEESGHSIQLDRPDVVIGAIREVLAAAQ